MKCHCNGTRPDGQILIVIENIIKLSAAYSVPDDRRIKIIKDFCAALLGHDTYIEELRGLDTYCKDNK